MTNTLEGVQLNVEESNPVDKPKISRIPIAGTGRHKIHNLGVSNKVWNLNCWLTSEAEYDNIRALTGTSPLTWIDKFGDSYDVSITTLSPAIKQHKFVKFRLNLEEVA